MENNGGSGFLPLVPGLTYLIESSPIAWTQFIYFTVLKQLEEKKNSYTIVKFYFYAVIVKLTKCPDIFFIKTRI